MNFKEMLESKKVWKNNITRVKSFPKDYQIMYKEIQKYFFKMGVENVHLYIEVIDFLEEGVNSNVDVVKHVGSDVAKFCDEVILNSK